jgi:hypothetical protein
MKTKIAGLILENGQVVEKNVQYIDFNEVPSDDPIAFFFGQNDAKKGRKLPRMRSREYRELASEYIRGFNSI